MEPGGIYIHVPFCAGKCPYCDFYSLVTKEKREEYVGAVIDEIKNLTRTRRYAAEFKKGKVSSLYLGGGTPTELTGEQLCRIITAATQSFDFTPDAEITVECNPSSPALKEKLADMAKAGVNRVSFGMQSAVDAERKKLGRRSDRQGIINAVDFAEAAGIENICLDIMLGIPLQTPKTLDETLTFAVGTGAEHISAYMLKLEKGTFFEKNADKLALPDDDETAQMYLQACRYLENHGYRHYEISNFCRGDKTGRHNMKYWTGEEYLGIGPAAHSFTNGARYYFPRDIDGFIAGQTPVYDGPGGDEAEKIMLGLRTDTGIEYPEKCSAFCEKLIQNGLAEKNGGRLILTDGGMLVSNSIISEILSETGL